MRPSLMSQAQADYYINRLRLFWNQTECAEEVGVSLISWRRWEKKAGLPSKNLKPKFEQALMALARRISRKSRNPQTEFYEKIAELLVEDSCPDYTKPDLPGVSIEFLHEQLVDRLYGKTVRSGVILDEFEGYGYTRMQIYHAINHLGVKKRHAVKGRGGYSLWSMPK